MVRQMVCVSKMQEHMSSVVSTHDCWKRPKLGKVQRMEVEFLVT